MFRIIAVCLALFMAVSVRAEETPATTATTVMTVRGKLLHGEDFNKEFAKEWKVAKGKWEIADGALQGSEVKEDMHAAAFRHAVSTENVVIEYQFKLDGATQTSLSLNSKKGHLSRVGISPTSISLRKDSSDKNVADKAANLDTVKLTIKPGEWHSLVVEQLGGEMAVSLDGKLIGCGKHEGLAEPISNVGLTVAGESVSFRNLLISAATPNDNWAAEREKFLAARKK